MRTWTFLENKNHLEKSTQRIPQLACLKSTAQPEKVYRGAVGKAWYFPFQTRAGGAALL
jgi:hypothetical protein